MLRKLLLVLAVLALASAFFVGCRAPAPPEEATEALPEEPAEEVAKPEKPFEGVELNAIWFYSPYTDFLKDWIRDEFTAETGISVKMETGGHEDVYPKIMLDVTNPEMVYDIWVSDGVWIPEMAQTGELFELTDEILAQTDAKDIDPIWLKAMGGYQGKQYGLPTPGGVNIMFFLKSLFEDEELAAKFKEKYGYDLEVPKDWDQYRDFCEFFTKSENPDSPTDYGTAIPAVNPFGYIWWLHIYWALGGNEIENGRMNYDNDITREAVNRYLEFFKYATPASPGNAYGEVMNEFLQGNVASLIIWDGFAGSMVDPEMSKIGDDVGFAMIPGRSPNIGGQVIMINPQSPNVDAALEFVKWFESTEIQSRITLQNSQTNGNIIGATQEAAVEKFPWLAAIKDSWPVGRHRFAQAPGGETIIPMAQLQDIIGAELQKVVVGEQTVDGFIKNVTEKGNKVLE